MPFIDATAAEMLETLAEDLERDGIQLVLARDVAAVAAMLEPLTTTPGKVVA